MKSLSKRALTGEAILDIVCGEAGRAMDDALKACGQSPTLYRNMMERIACEGSLTADERAEVALVLLVTALARPMCDAPWPRRALSPRRCTEAVLLHRPWCRCLRALGARRP